MRSHGAARSTLGSLIGFLALLVLGSATAEPLAPVPDKPILEISGRIKRTNKDGAALFDREMLEALGTVSFETRTPWHQGVVKFEGVLMSRVLEHVGATGERVVAVALNDYSVEIPASDFARFGTILALKRDGNYMSVRDKGPLFIVYPYDSHPDLNSQLYYGRSAWQLSKLIVK